MPDPLPQPILCPALIGRDAQIAVLTRLLENEECDIVFGPLPECLDSSKTNLNAQTNAKLHVSTCAPLPTQCH